MFELVAGSDLILTSKTFMSLQSLFNKCSDYFNPQVSSLIKGLLFKPDHAAIETFLRALDQCDVIAESIRGFREACLEIDCLQAEISKAKHVMSKMNVSSWRQEGPFKDL